MIHFQIVFRGSLLVEHISRPEVDSREFRPFSRAKVCPVCLEVWAVVKKIGSAEAFAVEGQLCEECPGPAGDTVPGSLLDDRTSQTLDLDLIAYLPLDLRQREFRLHLAAIERDSHHERTADNRAQPPSRSECTDNGTYRDWEDLLARNPS